MYKLYCIWDKSYTFTFENEYEYLIASNFYKYLINPQVTVNFSIDSFEMFFLNKVSNLLRIREMGVEENEKKKYKPKRVFISNSDIYRDGNPENVEEFSDYYKGIWGLDN